MFEYMAAGLPVIASNFPYWESIIEKHECGICVDPTSVSDITKAIKTLLENPNIAKTMGENGLNAIKTHFNWEKRRAKGNFILSSTLKIKILILTQYFPPEIGAPQNRLFGLAKALNKSKVDVKVLTAMPHYPQMVIHEKYQGKAFYHEKNRWNTHMEN